ncbi:hypothetical protein [Bradyrhizobium sp. USDA 241]|uniref:hypothetical protein n=1 Tax=Bradyrhizobium sp. USDA 241 TaxID=3377725 RepID=UPI003C75F3A5
MNSLVRLALAGLLALASVPASATVFVANDPGGKIVDYIQKYSALRDTGEKVVVAGECVSACTYFLGLLPKSQFCTTPEAMLGFHSASVKTVYDDGRVEYTHAVEMSALIWRLYPKNVQRILKRLGWNGDRAEIPHPAVVWVKGTTLRAMAPPCTADDLT